jgi:hypothetical protein
VDEGQLWRFILNEHGSQGDTQTTSGGGHSWLKARGSGR